MGKSESGTPSQDEHANVVSKLSTAIDGIGPKTAEAFYDLDVQSFADLHRYLSSHTDKEVLADLAERGARVLPNSIEKYDWRDRAESLAAEASEPDRPPEETTVSRKERAETRASVTPAEQHDAAFTIFFDFVAAEPGEQILQTTVYEDRDFGDEQTFIGVDTDPWVDWILERAGLPIPTEGGVGAQLPASEAETAEPAEAEKPEETRVVIQDLQTSAAKPSSGMPEKRLMAEVRFRIVGTDAQKLAEDRIPFRVEVHTVDTESHTASLVTSSRGNLQSEVYDYVSRQEFTFPPLGRYDLYTIVLLLPPGGIAAYYKGDPIRIVP